MVIVLGKCDDTLRFSDRRLQYYDTKYSIAHHGSISVALSLKFQLNPRCKITMRKSDEHVQNISVREYNILFVTTSQVSWHLLSILTDLNKAVVWMVSNCPLISKFSSPFTNILRIDLGARITISIMVTFRFHSILLLF